MKCPKCGYTSFDYVQVCPKCNKDISGVRDKMKLPSYAPNPPSLLNSLIGKTSKSNIDLKTERVESMTAEEEIGFDAEELQGIYSTETPLESDEENKIQLESLPVEEIEEPSGQIDLSDLGIQDADIETKMERPETNFPLEEGIEEDLTLEDNINDDLALEDNVEEDLILQDDIKKDLMQVDDVGEDLILQDSGEEDLILQDSGENDLMLDGDIGEELIFNDDGEDVSLDLEELELEDPKTGQK